MNISSYSLTSSDDVFSSIQANQNYAKSLNVIRDNINNFGKSAEAAQQKSAPNPVSPAVVLDISGTAKMSL
jgi:hypothetical protein